MILIGPSPCYINDEGYQGGFEKKDIEELLDTMDKNYIGWANFLASAIMKNPDRPQKIRRFKKFRQPLRDFHN